MPQNAIYARRTTPRVDADSSVNALWHCTGSEDVSHIRNLNLGGVFLETPLRKDLGAFVEIDFLVNEGPIHARAVVRHVAPGHGLGLRLLAMNDKHRLHFGALMKRLYSACRTTGLTRIREQTRRPTDVAQSGTRS